MVFLTFFGEVRTPFHLKPGVAADAAAGRAGLPVDRRRLPRPAARPSATTPWFSDFMHTSLPETKELAIEHRAQPPDRRLRRRSSGSSLAYYLFLREPGLVRRLVATPVGAALHRFWFVGWGFDWAYDNLIVGTYVRLSRAEPAPTCSTCRSRPSR